MTLNFLKLNVDKSQSLVCGKKRFVNVHQSPISRLLEILKIGSDMVHSSKQGSHGHGKINFPGKSRKSHEKHAKS